MARSKWKFCFFSKKSFNLIYNCKLNINYKFKNKIIYNRSLNILNCFDNLNFYIYKGNIFKFLKLNKYYTFYKFGEFSFSRKPFKYPFIKKKR